MPWALTDPMTERARFVLAHQGGLYSVAELCQRFGVSRKTGYKWLRRFKDEGLDGLADQPRAPKRCPHKTTPFHRLRGCPRPIPVADLHRLK
jgi:transposase